MFSDVLTIACRHLCPPCHVVEAGLAVAFSTDMGPDMDACVIGAVLLSGVQPK